MSTILIKNGKVWDGESFSESDIFISDGLISDVGNNISTHAEFTYDAKGKIVSPGLVDIHTHLKGVSSDTFGILAQMACLPFGVTYANDCAGGSGDKKFFDSLGIKSSVFVSVNIDNCHSNTALTQKYLEIYQDRAIGLKTYFDSEMTEAKTLTPLEEACEFARQKNLPLMVHCSNSPLKMAEIVKTLSKGDILTHIYHGGKNSCTDDDFEAFRIAKEKGVILDAGFAGHVHTNFSNFKQAVERGFIPDTISTDITCRSAYKRGGRYGMTMCMSMAKTAGICEEDIFRLVTSSPAKVLKKDEEIGFLKIGRVADVAVFEYADEGFELTDNEGNKISDKFGYRCVLTVCDGEVVYRR